MFVKICGTSKSPKSIKPILLLMLILILNRTASTSRPAPVEICEAKIPEDSECYATNHTIGHHEDQTETLHSTISTIASTEMTTIVSRITNTISLTSKLASTVLTSPSPPRQYSLSTITSTTVQMAAPSRPDSPDPMTGFNFNEEVYNNRNRNPTVNSVLTSAIEKDTLAGNEGFNKNGHLFCTVNDELHSAGTNPGCNKIEKRSVREGKQYLSTMDRQYWRARSKRDARSGSGSDWVVGQQVPLTREEREQLIKLYGPRFNLGAAEAVKSMRQNFKGPAMNNQRQNQQPSHAHTNSYNNYIQRNRNNIVHRSRKSWSSQVDNQKQHLGQRRRQRYHPQLDDFYGNQNERNLRNFNQRRIMLRHAGQGHDQSPEEQGPGVNAPQVEGNLGNNGGFVDDDLRKRSNLIKMLVNELNQDTMHHIKEEEEESDAEDECSLYETWFSPVAGVGIDLQPLGTGIMVRLEVVPGVESKLLSPAWIGSGILSPLSPTTITLIFQERSTDEERRLMPSTAVFVGQCVYCNNGTAMQGTWVIYDGSRTCTSPFMQSPVNPVNAFSDSDSGAFAEY